MDPVAAAGVSTEVIRRAAGDICSVQEIDPLTLIDTACPHPVFSELFKRRILAAFNPYYEK